MSGASPDATRAFAGGAGERGFSRDAYRGLGRTGLMVSAVGFGAYRVDSEALEHREALRQALRGGCNLIDTSTNYTDGASETGIGEVLGEMIAGGEISRPATVVVSKIGYVQGKNMDLAREREQAGDPFPEMLKISEGCWHCIHPRFLADQLGRSLRRLGLERLDACLLHNPEYFLEHPPAGTGTGGLEELRRIFYSRVRSAFTHFEKEVRDGRIAWYGVSSNSFGAPPGEPGATSLGRMLEEARAAAAEAGLPPEKHHFAVAQLPMNLYERDPLTVRKEGPAGDESTLGFAERSAVGLLVNRPLNAFAAGELIRLSDFPTEPPELPIPEALEGVAKLEEEFARRIAGGLRLPPGSPRPADLFPWGRQLAAAAGRLGGYEHWEAVEERQIHPRVYYSISLLRSTLPPEDAGEFQSWLERYVPELRKLLGALRADCAALSRRRSAQIAARLDPGLPAALRSESLSRKALHAVASLAGVTSVLNGMRRPLYVRDSMEILKWPRLPQAAALFAES
ncbi:MAG TPA: aldo/keto reductase [Candidatus Polarisedimenticolia bacterium]|nr:aldo/keto reductase [Candidatus Polarisedimenticolia bacterium]